MRRCWTERLRRGRGWRSHWAVGRILSHRRAGSSPSDHQRKETTMSPLPARMIEDMTPARLAVGTQEIYTPAVYRLAKRYRRSPDPLRHVEPPGPFLRFRPPRGSVRLLP